MVYLSTMSVEKRQIRNYDILQKMLSWSNLKYNPGIFLWALRNNMKNLSAFRCPGQARTWYILNSSHKY
jgi:hypothetical protein